MSYVQQKLLGGRALQIKINNRTYDPRINALNNIVEGGREFLSLFSYAMAMFFLMNQLRNSCNLITNQEPSRHMRPLIS